MYEFDEREARDLFMYAEGITVGDPDRVWLPGIMCTDGHQAFTVSSVEEAIDMARKLNEVEDHPCNYRPVPVYLRYSSTAAFVASQVDPLADLRALPETDEPRRE